MRTRLLLIVATALLLSACGRWGTPLERFEYAVRQSNADQNARMEGRVSHPYDMTTTMEDTLMHLQDSVATRNFYSAEALLKTLENMYSADGGRVARAGNILLDQIHSFEQDDIAAVDKKYEVVRKQEAEIFMTAEKAKDLDPLLASLDDFQKNAGHCFAYHPAHQQAYRDLLETRRYVQRLQEYLVAREFNDVPNMTHSFRHLFNVNQPVGLPLERSQVLERLTYLNQQSKAPVEPMDSPGAPATNAPPLESGK